MNIIKEKQQIISAVEITEFSDPTMASAGVELLEQDAVLLALTPLRVKRVIVRLERAVLIFHTVNQRVRSNTSAGNNCHAYVVFGPQTRGTVNGRHVDAEILLTVEPSAKVQFVTEVGWQTITLLVDPLILAEQMLERRCGNSLPTGLQMLPVAEGAAAQLFDWGKRLVDIAERKPEYFNERLDVRMTVEAEFFDILIETLQHTSHSESTRKSQTSQGYSRMIREIETHLLSHVTKRLQVGDLCQIAGVSERTLENAFKSILGMTPLAYLTRVRLHRARLALLLASHNTTTVSSVALDWGFWHFGDFSRLYHECFGERPSETLRRRADEPQRTAK